MLMAIPRLATHLVLVTALSVAHGGVDCCIFWSDANTPLDLDGEVIGSRALMVSAHLTFVIASDMPGLWQGGCLLVTNPEDLRGCLVARDFNDLTMDWAGSRYPEAGRSARVWRMAGWLGTRQVAGFQFIGSDDAREGRWFCIDYIAQGQGLCQVEFYDFSLSYFTPAKVFVFTHDPNSDLDKDGRVSGKDLAIVGHSWRQAGTQADLDQDGYIGPLDLAILARHWLDRSK
ncbi:MAG: hypothetical protein QHH07_03130 [Sedimentisphaerales bacterium]|jgi:hypothetical protein|nr:hypothetical protein [Sedimentisphaerales bacterium]